MIVRRCPTFTTLICLILSTEFSTIQAERWSRHVSNSEWIPLANPRTTQTQVEQNGANSGLLASGSSQLPQLQQLSLPPALQQQYQEQLLQLQKTQENIQKLLLLQQQLRAQQQLLQSPTFLPNGFSNADEDKQLHQSALGSSQAVADLAPEDLVPPLPASEALPPVFPAQNFLPQRPRVHQPTKQDASLTQEFVNLSGQEFKSSQLLQQGQNVGNVAQVEENQRQGEKQIKESSQGSLVPQSEAGQDEEEEVQLVYVPAETLAQRGQPKRGRGRKQYPFRQPQQQQLHQSQQFQQPHQPLQQHRENQGVDSLHDQDTFARQILQQIQIEREEKAQFLKDERMKEIARLNEEQRALDRKARLQQEALQREQELQRQREAEKKKKELEKLEELAKQRELERIREAREKQRLEELERRRLAEIRAKEDKRRAEEAARQREAERLAALERQKELEIQQALKQQQILDKQRENDARLTAPERPENQEVQALPLIRDHQQQFHRQHLAETPKSAKSKVRGRQRQRTQYQEQQSYRETTTTPSPNQPPLSVYMGSPHSKTSNIKVSDVLKILKDAKTIAVLDTVGPDTPQVFVGPTSLDPPVGYAKFDLPYLSSIDHNRVERKVDKLPFFVAPLSFDPPTGYSKIPFPAPHIGSVVVNTLDNTDPKESDDLNPSPTPLIEPNSYLDGSEGGSVSTTPLYEPQTTIGYSQVPSSTPKYEQAYSGTTSSGYSGSRFRFRQFYGDNKPASVISTAYYDDQRPTTRKHKYYDENLGTTEIPVQGGKMETSVSHLEEVSYPTTPGYREETIGSQDPSGQLALINQELSQQREAQRYNTGGQYGQQGSEVSTGPRNSFNGEITASDINDVRSAVGPTQYSLPAELPAISPHLPGLVNSLLDKNEAKLQANSMTTTSTSTTTTTTTERTPTTTYRPRSRQRSRVVTTRPRTTTQAPSTKTNVDRSRRPYNRSRSRFSTTTEEYRESSYEPTKSRIPETTLRYNAEQRRPASRTQKHRSRDKTSQQSEVFGHTQNAQTQQSYDTMSHGDSNPPPASNAYLHPTGPDSSSLRQLDSSSSLNDYPPENYPTTTVSTTENYPNFRDVTLNHGSTLVSDDYSSSQSYPQNPQEDPHYRPNYDETTLEQTGLEKTPVNGFNYQLQNGETLGQGILQRPKDYQLNGKGENSDFELATTNDPRTRTPEEQRYSSIYEVNVPQTQPEYSLTGQDNLHRLESEKIQAGVANADPNEQPIFIPLAENKQEDYVLAVSSTEPPLSEITTETTTTSTTPVVIRQRVRGRVGTRLHHEPSVQTRTRGSQDEYVRFNVVNQDSTRTTPNRQRVRSRTRSQNHGSQVLTDGNEYINLHVAQQHRQIVTTTPAPSTTTTTVQPTEEDVDYGFIRPPNFRPAHPVDNRYQTPVTFRPQLQELSQQSLLPNDETAVESISSQTHLLKNRQKYQPTPNRRLPLKPTTLSPPAITLQETTTTTERVPVATVLPDDAIYTARPKSRPDDSKQIRIRGRVRRPGRKRVTTTSTTESVLEAHNELPLDENYPRIQPQPVTTEQQQTLYDDNYEGGGGFSGGGRNPAEHQFYETSSENYPSEFILNFGNYAAQPVQRDEYDQTQLASDAPRKYTQASRARPSSDEDQSTTADIYGAESQWSTKLTRTSFQPSFAVNRVPGEVSKDQKWFHESLKDGNPPEIITAAPELSSVTLVVSSDYKKLEEAGKEEEDESILMGTTVFGRKTNAQDHTEKMNETSPTTGSPVTKDRRGSDVQNGQDTDSWLMDRVENSTEQLSIDLEKTVKKSDSPAVGKKTGRRRRVRVRVRPAVDDFVTAESQHFNSAINGLFRDQYKYNPVRESKHPAVASSASEKSVFQDFLTEILKNKDEPVKTTTTEVPEVAWTMSPAMTTPMVIPEDFVETTEPEITTIPTTYNPEETTTMKSTREDSFSKLPKNSQDTKKTKEEEKKEKKINDEERKGNNWESTKNREQNSIKNTLNFESIADKYRVKENDDSVEDQRDRVESNLTDKGSETLNDGTKGLKEGEGSSGSLDHKEAPKEDEEDHHPKNHRAKWSEVRYPSTFDQSQASPWNIDAKAISKSSTTSIPGLVTKNEGDSSVRTLSDYVQAIFDTMKSAEEETIIADTENPNETTTTTVQPPMSETDLPIRENSEQEKSVIRDVEAKATTPVTFEGAQTTADVDGNGKTVTQTTESTTNIDLENATTLERGGTTPIKATSSSSEHSVTDSPATTTSKPGNATVSINSTESILGKVLRTSTTTKVSHMTEICYRGRCVMTRPSRDDRLR